jgi:hypothetical protein
VQDAFSIGNSHPTPWSESSLGLPKTGIQVRSSNRNILSGCDDKIAFDNNCPHILYKQTHTFRPFHHSVHPFSGILPPICSDTAHTLPFGSDDI